MSHLFVLFQIVIKNLLNFCFFRTTKRSETLFHGFAQKLKISFFFALELGRALRKQARAFALFYLQAPTFRHGPLSPSLGGRTRARIQQE